MISFIIKRNMQKTPNLYIMMIASYLYPSWPLIKTNDVLIDNSYKQSKKQKKWNLEKYSTSYLKSKWKKRGKKDTGRWVGVVTYIYNILCRSRSTETKSLLWILLEFTWHDKITAKFEDKQEHNFGKGGERLHKSMSFSVAVQWQDILIQFV